MKIFLNLLSKKKNFKTPRPSTIKCNYTCEDTSLELIIKSYLTDTRTAKDCLCRFIRRMAYRDCLRLKENEIIFPLMEDFLNEATWKSKHTLDCGDYDPLRPEPWFRFIYSIYDNMLFDIYASEELLKIWKQKITPESIMQVIQNPSITPEIYKNKDLLLLKKEELETIINRNSFSPKEILLIIKENWNVLYHYQSTYEALEYCILCSENHTTPMYFDSAFRDLGYKLGKLYKEANEK